MLILFEVVSLTASMIGQYPAWTVGRSNLAAIPVLGSGRTCGLADDVLVEQDPNAGMLAPVTAPVDEALGRRSRSASRRTGFPPTSPPTR